MKEFKTLGYDWECGHEDLIIRVLSYADRKRLYIGLYKEENGEWEDFGNLTVNLPHEDVKRMKHSLITIFRVQIAVH